MYNNTDQEILIAFSDQHIHGLKGYHQRENPGQDYKQAKSPIAKITLKTNLEHNKTIETKLDWLKQNGWLGWLIPENIYVFDYDIEDQKPYQKELGQRLADVMLKLYPNLPIIKTPRGWQFIFSTKEQLTQKQGSKESKPVCALLIPCDSRTNASNGYVVLPTSNTENRYWIKQPTKEQLENPLKEIPELPAILRIVKFSNPVENRLDHILDASERHNSLLSFCGTLFGAYPSKNPWLTEQIIKNSIYFIWQHFTEKTGREVDQSEVDNLIDYCKNSHPNRDTDKKLSQSDRLANYAKESYSFFKDNGNNLYAENKQGVIYSIESKSFLRTISNLLHNKEGNIASRDTAKEAIHKLEAMVFDNAPKRQTYLRSAYRVATNELYVWLGQGRILWITVKEWKIIKSVSDIKFLATENMKELPNPKQLESKDKYIESLKSLLCLFPRSIYSDVHKFRLLLAYIVTGWLEHIQRPILLLTGEKGSCKSTVSTLIKDLLDPCLATTVSYKSNEDLLIQASNSKILVFDNVSRLGNDAIDAICRLCTGESQLSRKRFTDKDTQIFSDMRNSIIFNGIIQPSEQADFIDRTLPLELERVEDTERKELTGLTDELNQILPEVLGAIAGYLVEMLRIKQNIPKDTPLARLADWANWAMSFYCSFYTNLDGYKYFIDDWKEITENQDHLILDTDPLITRLQGFLHNNHEFSGTTSELFTQLTISDTGLSIRNTTPQDYNFPKTANSLRRKLTLIKNQLEKIDIGVDLGFRFVKDGKSKRCIKLWVKHNKNNLIANAENLQLKNEFSNQQKFKVVKI